MEKIDIYKTIVKLNRIIETADLYLKKQLIFPIALIDDLGKIGDMGTEIEAYFKMSGNTNIIVEIEKIKRATLFQINSWCDIEPKTRLSITNCIRSLRNVVQNQQTENSQMDINTTPTKLTIHDDIHFNSKETKENLKTIFEKLKKGGYLHSDSDLNAWLCVCGAVDGNEQVQPLKWAKDQELLAHLVNEMFGDSDGTRLWVITKSVFLIKSKIPNTDTMKNTVSRIKKGWKDKPKKFNDLDSLLTT
ncbi:MAG: hypothetical protein PHH37_04270 [Paludibacter sp.]|nr:hypothetical protein [Paludibacter sp.]